jgi:Holliday junction DNA helicase RuvA
MIAELRGRLAHKHADRAVIDVGGVGYEVFISLNTFYRLPELGEPLRVLTHTHVREDALQLYGFLDHEEKSLYLLLTGVSGIGPRLAMNILSGTAFAELQEALETEDLARLVAIPGVGKKTAERMIVELRDKLVKLAKTRAAESGAPAPVARSIEAEAVSALVNLGYRRPEAETAAKAVVAGGATTLEDVIRGSLKRLSG